MRSAVQPPRPYGFCPAVSVQVEHGFVESDGAEATCRYCCRTRDEAMVYEAMRLRAEERASELVPGPIETRPTPEWEAETLLRHSAHEGRVVEGLHWEFFCRCGSSLRTYQPGTPVPAGFGTVAWRHAEHMVRALHGDES